VKRVVNGTASYLYYDGWSLIEEDNSAGTAQLLYVYGPATDELAAMWNASSSSWSWYHYDARGSVTHLTNAAGQLVEQYTYSAFGIPSYFSSTGQPLNSSTVGNRFLFQGRDWIKELSLYDYRNRMYHPGTGRFLQPDPLSLDAGDPNIYRYCNNDPINGSDPLGLEPNDFININSQSPSDIPSFPSDSPSFSGSFSYAGSSSSAASEAFSNWFYGSTPSSTSIFSLVSSSNFGFGLPLFAQLLGGQQGRATVAPVSAAKNTAGQSGGLVLDNATKDRLIFLVNSGRETVNMLAAAQQSRAEHSYEVFQSAGDFGQLTNTKFVEGHEKKPGYPLGSSFSRKDVPSGWNWIAHVYTQDHFTEHPVGRDKQEFDRVHIAGVMVTPMNPSGQRYPLDTGDYHLDLYNPRR